MDSTHYSIDTLHRFNMHNGTRLMNYEYRAPVIVNCVSRRKVDYDARLVVAETRGPFPHKAKPRVLHMVTGTRKLYL